MAGDDSLFLGVQRMASAAVSGFRTFFARPLTVYLFIYIFLFVKVSASMVCYCAVNVFFGNAAAAR